MSSAIRSVNKEFDLTIYFSKGDGNLFESRTEECHPDALLKHTCDATGNRHDILTEHAGKSHHDRLWWWPA